MSQNVRTAIEILEAEAKTAVGAHQYERTSQLAEILRLLSYLPASNDELTTQEMAILRDEGLVPCVKAVRERTKLALKDAKAVIDNYISYAGLQRRENPNGYATYVSPTA